MKENNTLLKGSTTMLILELLKSEDMYGYQMTKRLEQLSDYAFTLKEGTLYPLLHNLEKENYVESYYDESETLRKRKYYHITKSGLKLLEKKKAEWDFFSSSVNKVLGGGLCEQLGI